MYVSTCQQNYGVAQDVMFDIAVLFIDWDTCDYIKKILHSKTLFLVETSCCLCDFACTWANISKIRVLLGKSCSMLEYYSLIGC